MTDAQLLDESSKLHVMLVLPLDSAHSRLGLCATADWMVGVEDVERDRCEHLLGRPRTAAR